jgi:hypothetical protein
MRNSVLLNFVKYKQRGEYKNKTNIYCHYIIKLKLLNFLRSKMLSVQQKNSVYNHTQALFYAADVFLNK